MIGSVGCRPPAVSERGAALSPVRAKDALGAFLRARREALRPEDIGLRRGPHRRAGGLRREEVAELCGVSADYVGRRFPPEKHLDHPEVGSLDLYCQTLLDDGSGQTLLVFTAAPGSASHDRLALLSVVGRQLLEAPS